MVPQSRYRPGDYINDQYQVHRVLMGGMGEVYLSIDIALDEPVAVKTYQTRYLSDPRLIEAFVVEARTWVMLEKHPNIVHAKSVFVSEKQPFAVVEWVTGDANFRSDLRNWLHPGHPLEISLVLDFAIQFCYGAAYAYRKLGLVHRDVKPENILITRDRILKITDFGLAQMESDIRKLREENTGGIVGTPVYMAPEQWLGARAAIQADIYSFGCTLFEMITGRWVFQGTSLAALRKEHLDGVPLDPRTLNSSIPHELATIVLKCLEKNPTKRFFYYEDLIEQLKEVYSTFTGEVYKPPAEESKETGSISEAQLLNNGDSLFTLGRYSEAFNYYDQLLGLNPLSSVFWQRKAECLRLLGKLHEALIYFNEAIKLETNKLDAVKGKTKCLIQMTRHAEALAFCNPHLALNPNDKELLQLKRELLLSSSNSLKEHSTSEQQKIVSESETVELETNSSLITPVSLASRLSNHNDRVYGTEMSSGQQSGTPLPILLSPTKIPYLDDLNTHVQERFDRYFQEIATQLQTQGIALEITQSAKSFICAPYNQEVHSDLMLEKAFENQIVMPLTDKLLSDELQTGDRIRVDRKLDEIVFEKLRGEQ